MISNIKKIVFQSLENEHFIQLSENFTNKTHKQTFILYIFVYLYLTIWFLFSNKYFHP